MPTVPSLNRVNPQRKVSESALPSVRVGTDQPIDAFGGGGQNVLEAQGKLNSAVVSVVEQERSKADQIKLLDASVKSSESLNGIFYNPKTGIFETMKGEGALGSAERFESEYGKSTEEIKKGLNNRQRLEFSKIEAQHLSEGRELANKYTHGEIQKYTNETLLATKISSKNNIGLKVPSGIRADVDFENLKNSISNLGKENGWGKEKVDMETAKEFSDTHRSVVDSFVANGMPTQAKDYRESLRSKSPDGTIVDGLIGDDKIYTDKLLRTASLDQSSKMKADELLTKYPNNFAKQFEEAGKITEASLSDRVKERITNINSVQERVDRQVTEDRLKKAYRHVSETMTVPPPNIMVNLTLNEQEGIRSYLSNVAKGVQPVTDWQLFYDLKNKATFADTREEFKNMNLMETARLRLDDVRFHELVDLQENMRTNNMEEANKYIEFYSPIQKKVNTILDTVGIGKDSKDVPEFRRAVDDKIALETKRSGKSYLSDDEVQKIVDKTFMDNVEITKGKIWGKNYRFVFGGKVQEESATMPSIDGIPPDFQQNMIDAYARVGRTATQEQILRAWNKKNGAVKK
jgi:hypothetical protein